MHAGLRHVGRPKGSRNKLSEAFIAKLYADFRKHGISAVKRVREQNPVDYLKVVASIVSRGENNEGFQGVVNVITGVHGRPTIELDKSDDSKALAAMDKAVVDRRNGVLAVSERPSAPAMKHVVDIEPHRLDE